MAMNTPLSLLESSGSPSPTLPSPPPTFLTELLPALKEINKVKALGKLIEWSQTLQKISQQALQDILKKNASLEQQQRLLEKHFALLTPLTQKLLSLAPELKTALSAQLELAQQGVFIQYYKQKNLLEISQARQKWQEELTRARQEGHSDKIRYWQKLGKGIFYPADQEQEQQKLSEHFLLSHKLQNLLPQNPAQVLKELQAQPNPYDKLPPTLRLYFQNTARGLLAKKQQDFAQFLLSQEQQGLILQEDALVLAEKQELLSPEQLSAYKMKLLSQHPLKTIPSLALFLENKIRSLLYSYNPQRDIRGERARSLLCFLACWDASLLLKKELLEHWEEQQQNTPKAQKRRDGHNYIQKLFHKDGFSHLKASTQAWNPSHWQKALKCQQCAYKALNERIAEDTLLATPTSPATFSSQLASAIYEATRPWRLEPFSLPSLPSLKHPLSLSLPQTPLSEGFNGKEDAPNSWTKALEDYFTALTEEHTPAQLETEIEGLYLDWLKEQA